MIRCGLDRLTVFPIDDAFCGCSQRTEIQSLNLYSAISNFRKLTSEFCFWGRTTDKFYFYLHCLEPFYIHVASSDICLVNSYKTMSDFNQRKRNTAIPMGRRNKRAFKDFRYFFKRSRDHAAVATVWDWEFETIYRTMALFCRAQTTSDIHDKNASLITFLYFWGTWPWSGQSRTLINVSKLTYYSHIFYIKTCSLRRSFSRPCLLQLV